VGRAGETQGLWPGGQVGHTRGWSVWTGGSGILCVCCFSFLTKRLVLASLSHSLGSSGRYKFGAGETGKGYGGQNPPDSQA